MIQSDALSRQPDFIPDKDTDNEDITMLPDNLFIQLLDIDLQRRIANMHDHDEEVTKALSTMMEHGPHAIQWELGDWTIKKFEGRDIVFFKGKNYIPRIDDLQRDITRLFHDHETAGHPGELKTYNALRQHYGWPRLCTYVKNYVRGCSTCQQSKIDRSPSCPSFLPTEGSQSTQPFVNCSMDFITDLPPVDGFDSILVVVDQGLTKGVILTPCKKTITAEETGRLLLENLYKRFGLLDRIISD